MANSRLREVLKELDPKYNFDASESLKALAKRMSREDWRRLADAMKYPRGNPHSFAIGLNTTERVLDPSKGVFPADTKYKHVPTYDGYDAILERVRGIINTELLTVEQKDSLLTKLEGFQYEIEEILSGRYDNE